MEITTSSRKFYIKDNGGIRTDNSTLYRAVDVRFKRDVAIKIVDCSLIDKNRAENEVSALSQIGDMTLRVPCVIDKHYDEDDNKLYIIMQWIDGETLRNKIEKSFKSPIVFMGWMIDLVSVLHLMEKKEFYHNDIKPENIIIDKANQLHLIDFNLTISQNTMNEGTAHYIAPEFLEHIEARKDKADMFSIGVMMYEYFTGVLPQENVHYGIKRGFGFKKTPRSKWSKFVAPKDIDDTIPQRVNDVIVKLMERIPSDRFVSYKDLKKEFISVKGILEDKNG